MRRTLLYFLIWSFLPAGCSLITKLEQPVERNAGDADADGDAGTDADEEVAPPCELDFDLVKSTHRPAGTLLTMEFQHFDGDRYPEAVVAGLQDRAEGGEPDGVSLLFRNEVLPSRERAFDASLVVALEPDQNISAARIGNFDREDEPEVLLFTEWRRDQTGRLLIVDSAHTTPNIAEGAVPALEHGLKNGIVLHVTGDRRFLDIAAIAWDEGEREGVLYSWEREDNLDAWRIVPPGEASIPSGPPEQMVAVDLDDVPDDELVVSGSDPPTLMIFDWNDSITNFEVQSSLLVDCPPVGLAAGDFDDDGQQEILMACGRDGLHVVYTDPLELIGSGGHDSLSGKSVFALAVADLDGNGTLDLVVHDSVDITVYCGDGRGDFTVARHLDSGAPETRHPVLGIIDVDDDGRLDIVEVSGSDTDGSITTYLAVSSTD